MREQSTTISKDAGHLSSNTIPTLPTKTFPELVALKLPKPHDPWLPRISGPIDLVIPAWDCCELHQKYCCVLFFLFLGEEYGNRLD